MSIEFDNYVGTSVGKLDAVLPTYDSVFTPNAYAALRAVMPQFPSFSASGEVAISDPQYIGVSAFLPSPFGEFAGVYEAFGVLDALLPEPQADFYNGPRLKAFIPLPFAVLSYANPGAVFATLTLKTQLAAAYDAPMVMEEFLANDSSDSQWIAVLREVFSVSDRPTVIAKLIATLEDSVSATDMFAVIFQAQIADEVQFDAQLTANLRMIYLLAEQLVVQDEAVPLVNAIVTVVSALVLADAWTPGLDGNVLDEVAYSDELAGKISAIVEMVEALLAEDELEPHLSLFALVEDSFSAFDDTAALVAMLAELLDTVSLGARITTPQGDVFVGYSMNVRTAAVSEYDNYPFNSMAVIGGIPYGAMIDGVYRLDNDVDDDGTPIKASVYTGLSDFGSTLLKQMPAAWIGLTSTGEMVLKVVTTDKGKKKENWYRMKARPSGTPVDSRFSPAKGLEGRYWGFKLENLDGADFTLEGVKVWPLAMNRRYSGR